METTGGYGVARDLRVPAREPRTLLNEDVLSPGEGDTRRREPGSTPTRWNAVNQMVKRLQFGFRLYVYDV